MIATEKDRWVLITDPAEQEALTALGKWREDKPTTVMRGDQMWALVNEQFTAWRDGRTGKTRCQTDNQTVSIRNK